VALNFGQAIESLKAGKRAARPSWNGEGMWIALVSGDLLTKEYHSCLTHHQKRTADEYGNVDIGGHIFMRTAYNIMQPGWSPSQADMLADDWQLVIDDGK